MDRLIRTVASLRPTGAIATDSKLIESPLVITVILNTNRKQDTLAALDSLSKNSYSRQRVIVLDNASTDGSVQAIRQNFPSVDIHVLAENRGYAGNNNVGIRAAVEQGADWILSTK